MIRGGADARGASPGDRLGSCFPLATAMILLCFAGCGPRDPADQRRAEIRAVLEAHLEHEDALLDILEEHRLDPATADAEVDAYVAEHGAAIRELCGERRLLEGDPAALAGAMRELEGEMSAAFERRRALADRFPELMARPAVRTALATLDDL